MDLKPTVRLTEREKAALAEARERVKAGKKLTASQDAALAKQRAIAEQQGFISLGTACPRELLAQILGANRDGVLRELGDRVGERVGKTVDLFMLFRRLATEPAAAPGRETAKTYGELAEKLGLKVADPERQLKAYHARGMPGRPGKRGRADGEWDVELCRAWIAVHVRSDSTATEEDLREQRRRLVLLDLQQRENTLLEQLGRLADVDEIAAYVTSCIANARAVLEGMADEVLTALPGETADDVRRTIHAVCVGVIDTACDELARAANDDDSRDDTEGTG